jgi:biotin carboxyl carrier protein
MEFKPKNREWVKNAAIVFLAVLLVLTFFSNTIMNRTLPEVATAAVQDGSIVAKVRGTGTVKANGNHDVTTNQTREIRSVMVKVGQEVETGDTLFVLGSGDSEELEAAKETLKELQYSYQKQAINLPTFNTTSESVAVKEALANKQAADSAAEAAQKAYDNKKAELDKDASKAETIKKTEDAKAKMDEAYASYSSIKQSYDAKYQELSANVVDWQNKVNSLVTTSPVPSTATTTPDSGTQEETESSGTVASTLANKGKTGKYIALAATGDMTLEEARAGLANAQAELDEFEKENQSTLTSAQSAYESAKSEYETLSKYSDSIYAELVPYKEKLDKAKSEQTSAQNAYDIAVSNMNYTNSANQATLASASIDLQQLADKIKTQQEKVKQLSGESGDEITANVSGVVTSIGCSAGDTVTKDTVLCTIEVPDMGYTLTFSVTNDQAQRLRVGDTATVSNYYWGKEIVATLSSIVTDPKNPQTNKNLTFDLSGDVTSGSELTISVGQKSANYDTIVPNSSIRSDSNGQFVLAIEAKSSPLGNRYVAKRVSVDVLASDDDNSAVVADLGWGDYVITTSSSPVSAGDQVRMAESG